MDNTKLKRTFYLDQKKVQSHKFYNIISTMPKGALLHMHVSAVVNPYKFLLYLKKNNINLYNTIYYVTDENSILNYINKNPSEDYKKTITSSLKWQTSLGKMMRFNNSPPCSGYTQLSKMSESDLESFIYNHCRMNNIDDYNWKKMDDITNKYWIFIRDVDLFNYYIKFLLTELYNDGIRIFELKTTPHGMYKQLNKEFNIKYNEYIYTYDTISDNIMENIININLQDFNRDKDDKLYYKLIIAIQKPGISDDDFKKTQKFDQLKGICNEPMYNNIGGIDLQGPEDTSINISQFTPTILENCSKKNFTIHSGESIINNDIYNKNLFNISYLKTINENNIVRIGHGIDLKRTPDLYPIFKKLKIHIELCPLSNYILQYINDIKSHPGKDYIREGLRVSINSDDPSPFGYDYVSFDWIVAIYYWKLTLQEMYSMCIYSIEDSTVGDLVKFNVKNQFEKSFKLWFDNIKIHLLDQDYNSIKDKVFIDLFNFDVSNILPENTCEIDHENEIVNNYKQKYLKYKNKYLELKFNKKI
jgi:adenosine deaminase